MKRFICIGLLCFFSALLQTTLMSFIEVASIRPNLPVALTASFALMCGSRTGMIVGFSSGILLDLFSGGTIGFYAMIYTWTGYAAGHTYRIYYDDDIKTPLMLICICDLMYGLCQYITTFLIRGRIHFFFYLARIIIPEMIYTAIFSVFLYQLFYYVNKKTMKSYF